MDTAYLGADLPHPVRPFPLYLPYRGQLHLPCHPFGHLLAAFSYKAVVVGLSIETYPVHVQVYMYVPPVPMDKGYRLAVPEPHFLEEAFGQFPEPFGFQFSAVLYGRAQHKAQRVLPAQFVLLLDDPELLGNLSGGLAGQVLTVDDLGPLLWIQAVGHGGRSVRYRFSLTYHFLKLSRCCRISPASRSVSSANFGFRFRNMLVIERKLRWYFTNIL